MSIADLRNAVDPNQIERKPSRYGNVTKGSREKLDSQEKKHPDLNKIQLNIKYLHSFLSVYCLISDDENDHTNREKGQNGEEQWVRIILD